MAAIYFVNDRASAEEGFPQAPEAAEDETGGGDGGHDRLPGGFRGKGDGQELGFVSPIGENDKEERADEGSHKILPLRNTPGKQKKRDLRLQME